MTTAINISTKTCWKSPDLSAALIILLTVLVYMPVIRGGFVFDDNELITQNQMVRAGDGLYRFWCTTEAPDYYPLTSSLWWLEWRLWGTDATGYHVINVLFHAINAVMVWLILQRLKIPGAWLAGLVFAIHPVNVATVAWISEQKNTVSMFFLAASVLLYLSFEEGKQWRWYILSLSSFLFALFSKTAVVMLPLVLLGCVWWRRGRIHWKDVLYSLPYFIFSLVLGLVTVLFQYHHVLNGHSVRTAGYAAHLAAAGCAPWFYLYKALLPVNLSAVYPKWEPDASNWMSYVPGLVLMGGFFVLWSKRDTWGRPWLFALGYFVVMLFPVLGFFDQAFYRYSLVADHWQYYSIVGAIALVVAGGEKLYRRIGTRSRSWGMVAVAAAVIVLGWLTWQRASVYHSNETLWRDTTAKNPDGFVAHYNLAVALWRAGKSQEAVDHFEQAVKLKPDYIEAHNNLGNCLLQAGRLDKAIPHYERVLQIEPGSLGTHNNLGAALLRAGRLPEAIGQFEQVLRLNPDYAEAHYNLGVALERAGRVPEAIRHFERALQLKPDYAEARNRLARLRSPDEYLRTQ